MRKSLTAALAASAIVLSFGLASAHAQESVPVSAAENGNLWFVELAGKPTADGNRLAAVRAEKAAFKAAARAAGVTYKELRSFDVLFNGYSVDIDAANRSKLARVAGVKALWPVEAIQAPEFNPAAGAAPDLASAITMSGASIAHSSLGITGAGVKVAIMDTGIDYDHADLGGDGVQRSNSAVFPTARVVAGYDLVGDDYNFGLPTNPDPYPDDCGGHGSHVAGIVGANGIVTGVAPDVQFGAYRVFGCSGSTGADIMIAAMEMALADGMQVLNMSIGSSRQWPQYPTGAAATRLVNKGVVVVASIGNSGPQGSSPDGLYSVGAPGTGHKVIGVASFDNLQQTQAAFTANPGGLLMGFNTAGGAPPPPTSGTLSLSAISPVTGCNASDFAGFPAGDAALISRGSCTFHIKAVNAQNAGAAAVVLYNNTTGTVNPTVAGATPITIPFVAITQADGLTLASLIPGATITWGMQTVVTPLASGGLISGFSSFGLAADLSLKPDIGAPGGSIYSTVPIELGSWGNNSGTSMASPHVAGTAALMLEAKPHTPSNAMRARLQNSADPAQWWGAPGAGYIDNVHRQGAGMVDIDDAILADVVVEPGKLSLGESQFGPHVETISVKNNGSSGVTFDLSHLAALATGPQNVPYTTISYLLAPSAVSFSVPSVYVPAGGSASFNVTISPNAGLADSHSIYGGYIVLTPQGGGQVYRVPFAGFAGDYQEIQVLTPTGNGFPWLAQRIGSSYVNRPAGGTYLMGADIPYFLIHLDHQSRRVRLEAFSAGSGRSFGRVSDDEYVGRNSSATSFFAFTWDGWTFRGKGKNGNQWQEVPNGDYIVKISVLKALGDESNPAHWETWTSPVITIARP